MTVTTTAHADWHVAPEISSTTATGPPPVDQPCESTDREHLARIVAGETPEPDPSARGRMAALLHVLTGWSIFSDPEEREYVSQLWADDWNSPEDSVYDQ